MDSAYAHFFYFKTFFQYLVSDLPFPCIFPDKYVLVFNPRSCQPVLEVLGPDISRLNINQMFVHFPYKPFKKLPNSVLCFTIRGNPSSYLPSLSWKRLKALGGGWEKTGTQAIGNTIPNCNPQ